MLPKDLAWDGIERVSAYAGLDRSLDSRGERFQRQQAQKWLDELPRVTPAFRTLQWLFVATKQRGVSRHRLIWLQLRLLFRAILQRMRLALR